MALLVYWKVASLNTNPKSQWLGGSARLHRWRWDGVSSKNLPQGPGGKDNQKKREFYAEEHDSPPPQENDRKNMRCLFSKWWSKNNCGMWKFQKVALICLGRCFSSPSNVCDFFVCPEKKSCWTFSTTKNRITSQTSLCLAAWSIVRARSWYFCHLFFFGEPGVFHLWWSSRGLGRGMALLC